MANRTLLFTERRTVELSGEIICLIETKVARLRGNLSRTFALATLVGLANVATVHGRHAAVPATTVAIQAMVGGVFERLLAGVAEPR
jgi:hypothetical protein